jgi:hypothetical protein
VGRPWGGVLVPASGVADGDGDDLDDSPIIDAAGADADPAAPDAAPRPDATPPDPPGLVRAAPASGPVVVDGDDAEFAGARRYAFALDGSSGNYIADPTYTPSMSAAFRVVHTEQYVAWFVEITDDQLTNNNANDEVYLDDGLSLYIDRDGNNGGQWQTGDREIIIDIGGALQMFNDTGNEPVTPEIARRVDMVAGGVTIEARLARNGYWVPERTSVGFNLALFDDDGANPDEHNGYYPSAYGLYYAAPGPHCADCCDVPDAWDRPEAWCDTTFNGTLQLDAE